MATDKLTCWTIGLYYMVMEVDHHGALLTGSNHYDAHLYNRSPFIFAAIPRVARLQYYLRLVPFVRLMK